MPSKIRALFKKKDKPSDKNYKASERSYTPPLPDPIPSSSSESSNDALPRQRSEPILKNSGATLLSKRFGKNCSIKSRDGVPIITSSGADDFSPSLVQGNTVAQRTKSKKEKRSKTRPTAQASAFGGAPRYDWMDIETAAAIKVQSIYRRNRVLKYLEENNMSTPGMRNRRRKRQAKQRKAQSEDVPFPFNMCGVGFLFGDATAEEEAYTNSLEKKKKDKQKVEMEAEDAKKRKFRMRKKGSQHLEEGIEVVESFEGQEDGRN